MALPNADDLAVRARHGASTRERWLRSLRKPYSPIAGAFEVGAKGALFLGALYPAVLLGVGGTLMSGAETLLLALMYFTATGLPVMIVGGVIGRYLSRFAYVDSPRRLWLQGALLGAAAGLLLALPAHGLLARRPSPAGNYVLAWLVATGALAGAGAGREVAGWNGS